MKKARGNSRKGAVLNGVVAVRAEVHGMLAHGGELPLKCTPSTPRKRRGNNY